MTGSRARRGLVAAALFAAALRSAAAQEGPVPVVAIGEGRTFAAALAAATRMAVESGAGATVAGAVASSGERVVTDSVRAVSRGVVRRYALLDSATTSAGARVKILAMVSPIAERSAVGAPGRRIEAPGGLWSANAAVDSARRANEGALLSELFAAPPAQPSAYAYDVEAGPPVQDGQRLRLRLTIVRSPSPAYGALRDRARAILAAIEGPAGARTIHEPPRDGEVPSVRACVSHCDAGERIVLNPRAVLGADGAPGAGDPPAMTRPSTAHVRDLFPELSTAGGFAVAFPDSSARKKFVAHVRSTRGFVAVADYVRATFDDARFHLQVGGRSMELAESFRAPQSGRPEHRFTASGPAGALPVELVRGFRPRSTGGPGASTTLGSPYVVLSLPFGARDAADTALVDVILSSGELARLNEISVGPVSAAALSGAPETRDRVAPLPGTAQPAPVTMPAAVAAAVARPPLADGDGAVPVDGPPATVVAVGTAIVRPAAPTEACAVARLRAQRELTRYLTGSHLESRTALSSSETRGAEPQETFREDITETVAGRLAGAALAAQWNVGAPARCRVAVWLLGR